MTAPVATDLEEEPTDVVDAPAVDDTPEPVDAVEPDDFDEDDDEEYDAPADEAAPEPDAVAPEPDASASAPAEPEDESEPATIDYDGGSYTIPHTVWNATRNSLDFKDVRGAQRAHTLMKHGAWYEAVGRRQLENAEKTRTTEVAAAKADAQGLFDAFMEAATGLSEEDYVTRMLEFRAAAPGLRHDMALAERDRKIAELEGRTKTPDTFPEPPQEHLVEWAESQAIATLRRDAASGDYPWMTPECVAAMQATLADPKQVNRYIKTADANTDPRAGLRIGQPYFDPSAFYEAARPIASAWQTAFTQTTAAKTDAAKQVQTLQKTAQQNGKILAAATPARAKAPNPPAVAAPVDETDEEREARARNELGQFIRSNIVRVRVPR